VWPLIVGHLRRARPSKKTPGVFCAKHLSACGDACLCVRAPTQTGTGRPEGPFRQKTPGVFFASGRGRVCHGWPAQPCRIPTCPTAGQASRATRGRAGEGVLSARRPHATVPKGTLTPALPPRERSRVPRLARPTVPYPGMPHGWTSQPCHRLHVAASWSAGARSACTQSGVEPPHSIIPHEDLGKGQPRGRGRAGLSFAPGFHAERGRPGREQSKEGTTARRGGRHNWGSYSVYWVSLTSRLGGDIVAPGGSSCAPARGIASCGFR